MFYFVVFFWCLTTYSKLFRFRWGHTAVGFIVGSRGRRFSSGSQVFMETTRVERHIQGLLIELCSLIQVVMFFPYVTTSIPFFVCTYHLYSNIWSLFPNPKLGRGPLVFGGKMTHNKWGFGQPWSTPEVEGRASSRTGLEGPQGVNGRALMPVVPHAVFPTVEKLVFLPMSVPGPVRFPTTTNGGVIQENCHELLLGFFFWYTQRCQKGRDGC